MVLLPRIPIRGLEKGMIFSQGGMGAGVSLAPLAGAVAQWGGIGTVSPLALDRIYKVRYGLKVSPTEAVRQEIEKAKQLSLNHGANINTDQTTKIRIQRATPNPIARLMFI